MAGTVKVEFVNQASFADAGHSSWTQEANLKQLGTYLEALGRRWLPADQVLTLQVLDVDLAGTEKASRRGAWVRVVRGRDDFPRFDLRYTLEAAGGKQLAQGTEHLSDLDYSHGVDRYQASEPLYYEKHMLQAWFKQRFVDGRVAAR
jgi:hypothetical protein